MKQKAEYLITFTYDSKGHGTLTVCNDSLLLCEAEARTGSIDKDGNLKNTIKSGTWFILDKSKPTSELGMCWDAERGWKIRLYNSNKEYTHYLIHPDGGKIKGNGTAGCIGLQGTFLDIRNTIDRILKKQTTLKVEVKNV